MLLPKLVGLSNAKLTARLLLRLRQEEFCASVKFGHATRPQAYPRIDVPHPLSWFVLRHGTVQVGGVVVCLPAILARRSEPALTRIAKLDQLRPALDKLGGVEPAIHPQPAQLRALWLALIKTLTKPDALADESLRDLWTGAAKDGVVPVVLPNGAGEIPLSEVFVSGSPDLVRRARAAGHIVVTLADDVMALWQSKGARSLSEIIEPQWERVSAPVELLVSVVPEMAEVLRPEAAKTACCQCVIDLTLRIAKAAEAVSCLMWGNTLLLDTGQLGQLSRAERLNRLVSEVAGAGWLAYERSEALRRLGDAQVDKRRAEVACGGTLPERLWLAVGKREEPLRTALGEVGSMDFIRRCTPLQLAGLTLAQFGPTTLSTLKAALDEEGLKPPSRWNTAQSRAFVASIGFPAEFATAPETRREPEEFISGPMELPPLHDFQVEVWEGIRTLIANATLRRRAVVSLPTGAGKTRVTVEAAVLLVLRPEGDRRTVIWVAHTDELCEQAVQAFRQVWLNLGAQRTDLRIVRLWGGNPNPEVQESGKPVVVVASIQTLNSRMGVEGVCWMREPGLVVVDECHHAITPSYTSMLRWLDADSSRDGPATKNEPPIVGLSATPFRMDDEESRRLARRFDNRWFPRDQAGLHRRLRDQGVLANVRPEPLESGIGLSDEEIERLSHLSQWEGIDFENILEAINQRLGSNVQRNERLVKRIQQAEEQSILFFTNSVRHAEEMSARLNLMGITAAAVSGSTQTVARRYFLDRFQYGKIRVLCNHTVLTTGFDAPKTDMVLIARQVFSPVRYMQMVGRGLRGKKNGGKECCRIVTVLDNLGRFRDRHPYHYCQQYFSSEGPLLGA